MALDKEAVVLELESALTAYTAEGGNILYVTEDGDEVYISETEIVDGEILVMTDNGERFALKLEEV